VRTHPWWVAGLAALAAAVTVCALALAGAFDSDPVLVVKPAPVLVVEPTTGGIDQVNAQRHERLLQHGVAAAAVTSVGDTKGDLPASQLGHGAAGYGPAGDTKNDVHPGTPAVGQELASQAGTAAGAGH
jgi:hypothetical protein